MGGGMEVHKNRWIEEWNAGRENLEFNFRWTRRSLAVVGLFGLAVPILVYKGIVREFVRTPPVPYRESSSCLLFGWLLDSDRDGAGGNAHSLRWN